MASPEDTPSAKRSVEAQADMLAACARGAADAVAAMLDQRPDLLTPALWPPAIYQGKSLPVTRLLLQRGLSPNECSAPRRPLHLAVYQCLPDIVELLIADGADVNQINPLGERPIDLLDAYEPRPLGDPDAKRIRDALRAAGVVEDIHAAVRAGDVETVRRMLAADVSLVNTLHPWPPLFTAARSGRVEVAKLLIKHGAAVDATNTKTNTPLWFACQSMAATGDRIAIAVLCSIMVRS